MSNLQNVDNLKSAALTLMRGDEQAATTWLNTPLPVLNNQTPVEHVTMKEGAQRVEDLIGRLHHGVFT